MKNQLYGKASVQPQTIKGLALNFCLSHLGILFSCLQNGDDYVIIMIKIQGTLEMIKQDSAPGGVPCTL